MNPCQRVSTTRGATPREINESSLQLIINCQQTRFQSLSITGARQSTRLAYTSGCSVITAYASSVLSFFFSSSSCAISNADFRVSSRRVNFFSLIFSLLECDTFRGGPVGNSGSFLYETFEPEASGLEGQRYILAKPRAHSPPRLRHSI